MSPRACVMTSAHPAFDVRIFHKECKSLAAAGYDVTLIAPHPESQNVHGVAIEAVPQHLPRFQRMFKATWAIYKAARKVDADIYHFHDPELIPAGLLLRLLGKKVIYDAHEDLPRTLAYKPYIPSWLQSSLERLVEFCELSASRHLSGLVAATPEIAARFHRHNPHTCIVQNYPLLEEFSEATTDATRKGGHIAYVGARITEARGAREMIRALEFLEDLPEARLKLAGSIDSADLLSELSSMPGWKRTDYLGPIGRKAVSDLIGGAVVGLVVLHPETNYVNSHPVKLFEYMCAGIPVIASDFPVFRSIINGARCGLLVNPLDPREIAEAIRYISAHPAEARHMGESGRQAVRLRYNWKNEERKLLKLYSQVLGTTILRSPLGVQNA